MRAGRLRHSLALEKLSGAQDSFGGAVPQWVPVDTVMAEIIHTRASAGERSGAQTSALQALIHIYSRSDVVEGMRGVNEGLAYVIKAVAPYGDRGVYQELTCEVLR